ncbi:MAG TPA: phosphatase PAP2 family protein [Gammaproteobacteria bacterium]
MNRLARVASLLCVTACMQRAAAADGIETAGDVLMYALPMAAFGATFAMEDDREGSIQFLKSFGAAELVMQGLKEITDKRRPDGDCCRSFPSGHTSRAFASAAFIHRRYGLRHAIIPYVAAGFTGVSRIHAERHFVEDVVAGAAIGIASAFLLASERQTVVATPFVEPGAYGLAVSAVW